MSFTISSAPPAVQQTATQAAPGTSSVKVSRTITFTGGSSATRTK